MSNPLRVAGLLASLGLLLAPASSQAYDFYLDDVPNTDVNGCLTCHNNSAGGNGCNDATSEYTSCRNVFGYDFGRNFGSHSARTWDAALRDRDSDGDGRTNGQELVYFGSSFTDGASGQGSNSVVTRPGSASSRHTSECFLQSTSTWGFNNSPHNYTNCITQSRGRCTNNTSSAVPAGSRYFGFTCGCDPGYTGNGRRDLIDGIPDPAANGCTSTQCTPGRCGNGTCIELSPPSEYTCDCDDGYVFSAGTCQVDNPCIAMTDDCDPNADCAPDPTWGWFCTCQPGWNGAGSPFRGRGDVCIDINECAGNPCGEGHGCVEDEPNSYACNCLDGYVERRGRCVDVDECREGTAECDSLAICTNNIGSYDCACIEGFEGSGFDCSDANECETAGACDENATCMNEFGGFSCVCNEGWYGSGQTCLDDDDCRRIRCGVNEQCVNQIGAPGLCECAPGHERVDAESPCEPTCGDGVVTTFEECDDANVTAGDGCSDTCEVELGYACRGVGSGASVCSETCGDGLIHQDAGETCDDGADNNSDTEPDACRERCVRASCGDGVIDSGEVCDDGMEGNSDESADACRTTCVEAYCGDGVLDSGERCDPGGGEPLASGMCQSCEEPDAGVSADGGEAPPMEAGCTCRASGPHRRAPGLWMLALVALFIRRRARRS